MNERKAYLTGGGCGILLGLSYLVIVGLYVPIGPPPVNVTSLLLYLARNPDRWNWIIGLSVFTDLLFVPFAASIYFALRGVDRYMVFLATACILLFVFLDLAITWTNYEAVLTLAIAYLKSPTEGDKIAVVAAAAPIASILHSKLLFVYNSLTLAAGILLAGVTMLRSTLSKTSAYLGIVSGSAGVLAVAGSFVSSALNNAIVVASLLTTVWVALVGYQIYVRGLGQARR